MFPFAQEKFGWVRFASVVDKIIYKRFALFDVPNVSGRRSAINLHKE